VSVTIAGTCVVKKGDPGEFTVPCRIDRYDFLHTLCVNETSINLRLLAIYKWSGKVLGFDVDLDIPIILRIPFLAIQRALIDSKSHEIMF
ncbi:hypothetical protein HAX54_051254, partial [Datura stramonium]|nr:hypothetical protein [Datura stramonium]